MVNQRRLVFLMDENTSVSDTSNKMNDELQKAGPSVKQMTARAYLDSTVNPVLLLGLAELSRIRPDDPIEWLADYLVQNNPLKAGKKDTLADC